MNVRKRLLTNTLLLYVMRFSLYFFNFITVPYQTRVLGVNLYGKVGIASSFSVYFNLLIDFGFILSATETISQNRTDNAKISKVYWCVYIWKILLFLLSEIILCIISVFLKFSPEDYILNQWFLISVATASLIPDFLYRGMEDMKAITYRTVFCRFIFTILIFIFLKSEEDYLVIPITTFGGNLIALIWALYDIRKRYNIHKIKISLQDLKDTFKRSSSFFLSRIATTAYSATNTIILGFIDPTGISSGYYTAAYKLIATGQSALSPISDSLYPYMIKNKDFTVIKRVLKYLMPIIVAGCLFICFTSRWICTLLFGADFADAAPILVLLMPMLVLTLPNYVLGFPALGALGQSNRANQSIYISSSIHIINIVVLGSIGKLNLYTLAVLASIAVLIEVIHRSYFVWRGLNKIRR